MGHCNIICSGYCTILVIELVFWCDSCKNTIVEVHPVVIFKRPCLSPVFLLLICFVDTQADRLKNRYLCAPFPDELAASLWQAERVFLILTVHA